MNDLALKDRPKTSSSEASTGTELAESNSSLAETTLTRTPEINVIAEAWGSATLGIQLPDPELLTTDGLFEWKRENGHLSTQKSQQGAESRSLAEVENLVEKVGDEALVARTALLQNMIDAYPEMDTFVLDLSNAERPDYVQSTNKGVMYLTSVSLGMAKAVEQLDNPPEILLQLPESAARVMLQQYKLDGKIFSKAGDGFHEGTTLLRPLTDKKT